MRLPPGPEELERLAAALLDGAPLPADRNARSYEQRMAAKALSIAAYDREHDAADMAAELALFTALFGRETVDRSGPDDHTRIRALNETLAEQVRNGDWDDPPQALKDLFMEQTRARLARSNPKYLAARAASR